MQPCTIIYIFCFGLAVAAPQGARTGHDEPEELVIRLVLHLKRSDDGTQFVVDLTKSEESSSVVRSAPKPIMSVTTTLPIFAKNALHADLNLKTSIAAMNKSNTESTTVDDKKIMELNSYMIAPERTHASSDSPDRAVANGYINLTPQNSSTIYQQKRKQDILLNTSLIKDEFLQTGSKNTEPSTQRPKFDFKISLGGPTTERYQNLNTAKIYYAPRTSTTLRTTAEESTTEASKPDTVQYESPGSQEQPGEVLIDKAVADQGFGVLASRCESFAPGLVSDGAGGCTRPVARPKNKNYQGAYTFRSAAGNELQTDVKEAEAVPQHASEIKQKSRMNPPGRWPESQLRKDQDEDCRDCDGSCWGR